jgi:hypothetical protein
VAVVFSNCLLQHAWRRCELSRFRPACTVQSFISCSHQRSAFYTSMFHVVRISYLEGLRRARAYHAQVETSHDTKMPLVRRVREGQTVSSSLSRQAPRFHSRLSLPLRTLRHSFLSVPESAKEASNTIMRLEDRGEAFQSLGVQILVTACLLEGISKLLFVEVFSSRPHVSYSTFHFVRSNSVIAVRRSSEKLAYCRTFPGHSASL